MIHSTHEGRYVLGVGLSHDGSAVLLKDGEICVAIEKERITRIKHDGINDLAATRYCLETEGITIDDVSVVVQNANFGMMERDRLWWYGPRAITDNTRVVTISHHLAHAYSAVGTCPFNETAVLVIDGCGNALDECIDLQGADVPAISCDPELGQLFFEKDSFYLFRDGQLTPLYKDFSPWGISIRGYPMCPKTTRHSIGGLYQAVSQYVFRGMEDPGKLMGLAPYGRAGAHDYPIFDLRDGRVFVRYDWMERFQKPAHSYEEFKNDFQYYADIAYWTQKEVERAILYVAHSRYSLADCDNLSYAGGVALNAVANRRLVNETPFRNLYFQPAAGDNGLALGCAYYGWLQILKRERQLHHKSFSFGRVYEHEKIARILGKYSSKLECHEAEGFIEETASRLASGKIVGWFQDGSEFGPRALGFRSILADPRRSEVRDFINSQIKRREDFRPFAPSVLAEEVGLYFDCNYESPYMLLVATVRQKFRKEIGSVVHVDDSARIQTVTKTSSEKYWRLLHCFKEKTGISVLLNTSFNRKGMPIVETPEDAIEFFLSCPLDLLVIDRFVVSKKQYVGRELSNIEELFRRDILDTLLRHQSELGQFRGVYEVRIAGVRVWTIDLEQEKPIVAECKRDIVPDGSIELDESDFRTMYSDPLGQVYKMIEEKRIKVDGNPVNLIRILGLR